MGYEEKEYSRTLLLRGVKPKEVSKLTGVDIRTIYKMSSELKNEKTITDKEIASLVCCTLADVIDAKCGPTTKKIDYAKIERYVDKETGKRYIDVTEEWS